MTHQFKDPLRNMAPARIKAICADYITPNLSVSEIAIRHRIGKDRIAAIIRAKGIKERARGYHSIRIRKKAKRSIAEVFLGAKRVETHTQDDELERAKLILRQRRYVVYDATVTDGAKAKGYIRCDHKLMTRDEVIALALGRKAA